MSTIDKNSAVYLLLNDGQYPGDPQCHSIYEYKRTDGQVAYTVFWEDGDIELYLDPFVSSYILLWEKDTGLTYFGQTFLETIKP